MALTTSIRIDYVDLRDQYGIEITDIGDSWGTARFAASLLDVPLRDGSTLTRGKFEPRRISLKGYMKQNSQQLLIMAFRSLTSQIHPEGEGLGQVRLEIIRGGATTPEHFQGYFEDIKLGAPPQPWRIANVAYIELTFVCLEPFFQKGANYDRLYTGLGPIDGFIFNNSGSAISYPKIVIRNTSESNITDFRIVNNAVTQRKRRISPTLGGTVARILGNPDWSIGDNWGGVYPKTTDSSMIRFTNDQVNNLLPPATFQIMMWVQRKFNYNDISEHYLLSTNSNLIRLFVTIGSPSMVRFCVTGICASIDDSYFTKDTWVPIRCLKDESLLILNIGDEVAYSGTITYKTRPTQLYIGSDASSFKQADAYFDEIRILNYGDESAWAEFKAMDAPMRMHKGTSLYMPCDEDLDAKAWSQTELHVANTLEPLDQFIIDCKKLSVQKESGNPNFTALTDIIGDVTGEFPFLVPSRNNFIIVHDATTLDIIMDHKPRYL